MRRNQLYPYEPVRRERCHRCGGTVSIGTHRRNGQPAPYCLRECGYDTCYGDNVCCGRNSASRSEAPERLAVAQALTWDQRRENVRLFDEFTDETCRKSDG